jgi:DNA (cytosine-5)-methyltransferase 1
MRRIRVITVGSLFSGIGGLELGLERTEKFKTIWNCENDEYASAILRKHWPEVPNIGDITKVEWERVEKPDLICGGFPCQDISIAGKQKGIKEGTRSGLWFEFAKAIRILRPRYVLIENVPMLANNGGTIVLSSLAEIGYDAEWFTLSAAEVGAWHKRERFFIIAYAQFQRCNNRFNPEREYQNNPERESNESIEGIGGFQPKPCEVCDDDPNPDFRDVEAYGTEGIGRKVLGSGKAKHSEICTKVPNPPFIRIQGFAARQRERQFGRGGWWEAEPDMGRVANGVPNFVDRIKCLGNAVVPQVAQVIGEAIAEFELVRTDG